VVMLQMFSMWVTVSRPALDCRLRLLSNMEEIESFCLCRAFAMFLAGYPAGSEQNVWAPTQLGLVCTVLLCLVLGDSLVSTVLLWWVLGDSIVCTVLLSRITNKWMIFGVPLVGCGEWSEVAYG